MKEKHFVPSFHFLSDEVCYCGSNKAFGKCCGNTETDRSAPDGIRIVNNFLPKGRCARTVKYLEKQKRHWLTTIKEIDTASGIHKEIRDPARVTQTVMMGKQEQKFIDLFRNTLKNIIPQYVGAIPCSFESPQVLRYSPGGKYDKHADAEVFDKSANRWRRVYDRDVSLLLYLNDNYVGGELEFTELNYTFTPKTGDLVFFPSNHIFAHQSLPIQKGYKYALVSWAKIPNSPSVEEAGAKQHLLYVN